MSRAALELFAALVQRPEGEIELDRAALEVGAWDYPDAVADVVRYRGVLDDLARAVEVSRRGAGEHERPGARALGRALFDELGFRGNTADYYDPRNSFLREVLDRRTGIPITLAVVTMEVGRRVGVRATGVGFPGHFLVRVHEDAADDGQVIDPFNGGAALSEADLAELLRRVVGPEARFEPALLEPTSKRQILTRMLLNLAGIYGKAGDLFRSLEVLERLHILDASNQKIWRELESMRKRVDDLN
jgi:regulator of sirC expression with transglutaminase-like and TPR domain